MNPSSGLDIENPYPLPHLEYVDFFQNAARIILPLHRELFFGLSREIIGQTKFLSRIHWALQFQKPLLMPAGIKRADIPDSPQTQCRQFDDLIEFLKGHLQGRR